MATQIKLKRGTTTPTASDIANGEVAIDTSAKKFYINDNGTIKEIGGGTSSGDSSSPLSGDVRGYTGDGSTVAYTVTSGADVENVLVFINGVFQRPTTDYTVSGTTLTFGTAPVNGDAITIKELVEGENTFNDNPLVRAYTGDGSTVGYNVTTGKSQEEFLVFINGVFQRPTTDFTVSSGTLTFGTAPTNGDVISIKELAESSGALLTIVDDTSTTTTISKGESLKISGGSNVTTSLSGDTLTINSSASGDLTIADDSSTTTTLDLANDTLKVAGGTNITTSLSGDTLTINGPDLSSYLTSETNDLTSNVTWANVPDANITESSVTQHQAALSITESQISDLGSYITTSSFNVVDDSSTSSSIGTNETLKIIGGTNITTSISGDTLTINGPDLTSYATLTGTQTLTNKTISGSSNTLSNIGNSSLTNSSITINGTEVSLGGSTTISTASTLTISDDSSTTVGLSLNTDTLKVAGGSGVTTSISGDTLTISASGTSDVFKNIAMPDGSTVVSADSSTDTLTLAQNGLISITGDSSTDTVTVGTVSSVVMPFLKADGSSSDIDLQTSGTLAEALSSLHIPFTLADGSNVTTLAVA